MSWASIIKLLAGIIFCPEAKDINFKNNEIIKVEVLSKAVNQFNELLTGKILCDESIGVYNISEIKNQFKNFKEVSELIDNITLNNVISSNSIHQEFKFLVKHLDKRNNFLHFK